MQPGTEPQWVDRQGDVWTAGDDGLLHTPETIPFSRAYVEKKWGPLVPIPALPAPEPCELCNGSGMVATGPWGSRPPRVTCPDCRGTKTQDYGS